MKNRTILEWLARAACVLAVIALLYVLTAPPIIWVRYLYRNGDGGIPSFYNPLMGLAFSDIGAPVHWYFRVWDYDIGNVAKIGELPDYRLVTYRR
jgi:hypothetical protein